jgi:hypothetical protein
MCFSAGVSASTHCASRSSRPGSPASNMPRALLQWRFTSRRSRRTAARTSGASTWASSITRTGRRAPRQRLRSSPASGVFSAASAALDHCCRMAYSILGKGAPGRPLKPQKSSDPAPRERSCSSCVLFPRHAHRAAVVACCRFGGAAVTPQPACRGRDRYTRSPRLPWRQRAGPEGRGGAGLPRPVGRRSRWVGKTASWRGLGWHWHGYSMMTGFDNRISALPMECMHGRNGTGTTGVRGRGVVNQ